MIPHSSMTTIMSSNAEDESETAVGISLAAKSSRERAVDDDTNANETRCLKTQKAL
jgi:hypothetical protein